jgi:hypothetical protein
VAERGAEKPGDDLRRIVKDMGIAHADFFRSIRPLLEGTAHDVRDDGVSLSLGAGSVEIRLGPEGKRSLGNFHLPRTEVELLFRGCAPETVAAFIADFDTRFRRGGG